MGMVPTTVPVVAVGAISTLWYLLPKRMTSRQGFLSLLWGYDICSVATGKETDPVAFAAIEAPCAFEGVASGMIR